MSAAMMDAYPSAGVSEQFSHRGVPETHPRGKGFRILSRMARTQADDYTPRHRLDAEEPKDAVDSSIAS